MNFDYNDNTIFDIYTHTYDSTKRLNVINIEAEAENIHGHLQDALQSLQGLRETTNPDEKTIRYKLVVKSDFKVDTHLREGRLIRVTKTKNKYTNGWQSLDGNRDFRIVKINDLDATGRYIVVSLQDEGTDGTRR